MGNYAFEAVPSALIGDFEGQDGLQGWSTIGTPSVDVHNGDNEARIEAGGNVYYGDIADFFGIPAASLAGIATGTPTNGEAIMTSVSVTAGMELTFDFTFRPGDYLPYYDFSFLVVGDDVVKIGEVWDSLSYELDDDAFGEENFTYTFTESGTFNVGFGTLNQGDSGVNSWMWVDNVTLTGQTGFGSVLSLLVTDLAGDDGSALLSDVETLQFADGPQSVDALELVVEGDGGDNALYGLDNDDTLIGNGGDDLLVGGGGNDVMSGGEGDDVFGYVLSNIADEGGDDILDFDPANDSFLFNAPGNLPGGPLASMTAFYTIIQTTIEDGSYTSSGVTGNFFDAGLVQGGVSEAAAVLDQQFSDWDVSGRPVFLFFSEETGNDVTGQLYYGSNGSYSQVAEIAYAETADPGLSSENIVIANAVP